MADNGNLHAMRRLASAPRRSLAPGWELEGAVAAPTENPVDESLVAFTKPETASPCLLLGDLGAPSAGRGGELEIFYTCACSGEDMLRWVGVEVETEDGQRSLRPRGVSRVVGKRGEEVLVAGTLRYRHEDAPRSIAVAFQLAERAGAFALTNLEIVSKAAQPGAAAGFDGGLAHELRTRIALAMSKAAGEHKTPYYARLGAALDAAAEPMLIAEADRTLQDVDARRYGMRAPAHGPTVSIVMPAHNRADLIGEAIQSALAQTYGAFELLVCDDASDDGTADIVAAIRDPRVQVLRHAQRSGAAAARNTCLRAARGDLIAYLDSDNLWHPRYLELMLEHLAAAPGYVSAFASYFDVRINSAGEPALLKAAIRPFHLEDQIESPYIDLNSFIHRRELIDLFGPFDERLVRRQDYDLFIRYCWARDPLHVPYALNIYQRIDNAAQISRTEKRDETALAIIGDKVETYYAQGVETAFPDWVKKITILSWDLSRNHFAKPWALAEALSNHAEVELISFQFFDEPIFPPLAGVKPSFELKRFHGGEFPAFFDQMSRALDAITGDVIYAVKPRLPSLGLALLANYHRGTPVMLEANDLETVVNSPRSADRHADLPLDAVLDHLDEAKNPHALVWSKVLDRCVHDLPALFTHNVNLNVHYGRRGLQMRNVKDDALYDPARFDRDAVRAELGFSKDDRVILFGGLVRKHKGVFELLELLRQLDDPRYKLVFVGNRESPELRELTAMQRADIKVFPAMPPDRIAAMNLAADLVVLWLDPAVPASHYQSPYKMSDAFAMGPAIVASPTSDQAAFAERGLMWTAPFGDYDALTRAINDIFANPAERERRQQRARQFFRREFSYKAVPSAFALGASLIKDRARTYPVSAAFARTFSEFHRRVTGQA